MKNYWIKFAFISLLGLIVFSCSKDDDEIAQPLENDSNSSVNSSTSLNTAPVVGQVTAAKYTKILLGEELSLSITATDAQGDLLSYRWLSTGGEISSENKKAIWKAPNQNGIYTIKVVVSDGKDSSVVAKDFEVVGKYYFDFESPNSSWGYDKLHTNRVYEFGLLKFISLDSINSSAYGYALDSCKYPISIKTRLAINKSQIVAGLNPKVELDFELPTLNNGLTNLNAIRLYLYPLTNTWTLRVELKDANNLSTYQNLDLNSSGSKSIFTTDDEFHNVSITIDSLKKLYVYVDGLKLYESDALIVNEKYQRALTFKSFYYAATPKLKVLVDDFYLTTDSLGYK